MKNNWKRLTALLLAVILMLSLTGLGEEETVINDDISNDVAETEDVPRIEDALMNPDESLDDTLDHNLSNEEYRGSDVNYRIPGKKYVAFGDSLSLGTVFSPVEGGSAHRVKEEWRIPTKIAFALGMIDSYENNAVAGIGYTKPIKGETVVDKIKKYNFQDVQIVTIACGPNDHAATLGSASDSVSGDGTICGAISEILSYIESNNPKTQVVIIQSTPFGSNPSIWDSVCAGGWTLNDFDREVSALCKSRGCGYVNWKGCTYVESWKKLNRGWSKAYGPSTTHPNTDSDYIILGNFIARKISSSCYDY